MNAPNSLPWAIESPNENAIAPIWYVVGHNRVGTKVVVAECNSHDEAYFIVEAANKYNTTQG